MAAPRLRVRRPSHLQEGQEDDREQVDGGLHRAERLRPSHASLKPGRILQVGPFTVCWNAKPFGMIIEVVLSQILASASDPENN